MGTNEKTAGPLSTVLAENVDAALRESLAQQPNIEATLATWWEEAQAEWPSVSVDQEGYLRFLSARVPTDEGGQPLLEQMHGVDLYLAYACSTGVEPALALFEERFLKDLDRTLRPLNVGRDLLDEVKAQLRRELYWSASGKPALLTKYRGQGRLSNWLRVVAARLVQQSRRRPSRETSLTDELMAKFPATAVDEELAFLKKEHRGDFTTFMAAAIGELSVRERNILRQHYRDGLGLNEIATLYHVHRVTVSRWLATARSSILDHVRQGLMAKLKINPSETDSLIRLLQSQLDQTLGTLIGPDPNDGTSADE